VSPTRTPRVAVAAPASRHGTTSRFRLLADAVEEHRRAVAESGRPLRDRDSALYERLEALERSLPHR
jgi:hypothetical protein